MLKEVDSQVIPMEEFTLCLTGNIHSTRHLIFFLLQLLMFIHSMNGHRWAEISNHLVPNGVKMSDAQI